MSDDLTTISVMAAAIVCSVALPLCILLGYRAISGKIELSRTISLALIISLCCWSLFFGSFMGIRFDDDAFRIDPIGNLITYIILTPAMSLIIAPVSLLFGIGMLFVYLFGGKILSLNRVIILFFASWIVEILYLYVVFTPD